MADDALILVQGDSSGGGKREETKRANRQAILDAARGVFGEMGYEGASVRDIIRRTPLSVGAFYNYYRSKEEVY
ncbi:MAG: TetR/AcrR family transcriptional regulator, partial [Pseudomonadota bacterium]|nr:TetR/AcrR family transcriptional regulator [Pseudomonadota bacterium]